MDKLNNRRDHTEKKVNTTGKSDSEKWKRSSLYAMPTDKPRPESTSEAARERTSDSRDRPAYRDGRLRLAQQRQQAYQKDSSITPNLSASSISRSRRLGSDVNERKSNTGELGVPKGGGEQDEGSSRQQYNQYNQAAYDHYRKVAAVVDNYRDTLNPAPAHASLTDEGEIRKREVFQTLQQKEREWYNKAFPN